MRWNTGVVGIIDDWAVGHFCANQRTGFICCEWTSIRICGDEKKAINNIENEHYYANIQTKQEAA